MISRRNFLERGSMVAAGLSLKAAAHATPRIAPALDPSHLTPFVDPLPLPAVARSSGSRPAPFSPFAMMPLHRMVMREFADNVHRGLPPTRSWAFEADSSGPSSPGPIFETRSGEGLRVEWVNELP